MDHSCIGKYLFSVVFFIKTVLSLDIIKHCHQPCLRMSKTHQGLVRLLSIINPSSVLWTTFPLKVNADSLLHERKQFCLLLFVHVLILSARRAKAKHFSDQQDNSLCTNVRRKGEDDLQHL